MPVGNRFRHQAYTNRLPAAPHYVLTPGTFPPVGSSEFLRRMEEAATAMRHGGVTAVCLVHGSCAEPDVAGSLTALTRRLPAARTAVERLIQRIQLGVQHVYFDHRYARLLDTALNPPGAQRIPVCLFEWSNENHHLGRADGAVRLVGCLASLEPGRPHRVLLWGHGHAGNLFALATNLLGSDRRSLERFFAAADVYYRWPLARCVDIPLWNRVRRLLLHQGRLRADVSLDVVTFGTPVRYGWESAAYDRLVHFVHRREILDRPPHQAVFPPAVDDVLSAAEGDYVQQLAIAGTDSPPAAFAWRARLANRRLGRLLERGLETENVEERFRAGTIVPEEGTTLLVDYGPPQGSVAQHQAGHAVYTENQWLLFHVEEVNRMIYAPAARNAA